MNAEVAVLEHGQLSAEEREAAISRLRDYVDGLRQIQDAVERTSLERASDLRDLYEDRAWVAEYLKVSPEPTNARARSQWREDSEERFTDWAGSRIGLGKSGCRDLLRAAKFDLAFPNKGKLAGMRSLGPLYRLEKMGMEDRIPEAVKMAVDLAGGGVADASHTQLAVRGITSGMSKQDIHRAQGRKKAESWANLARMFLTRIIDAGEYQIADEVIVEMNEYLTKEAELAGMIAE